MAADPIVKVEFLPSGLTLSCKKGESIYEAAEREGFTLPLSCRNGVCCICEGHLRSGLIHHGNRREAIAKESDILLCKTWPQTPCVIEMNNVYGPGELPVKQLACQISSVSALQANVYKVLLFLPAGKLPEFYAGQYLAINLPDKSEPCYFSIASRPGQREVELHIQADPHLDTAVEVINYLKDSVTVSVTLPYGKACLTSIPARPVIFIAAGTGFAQMKSVVEELLSHQFEHEISLYWGVRQEDELYMRDLANTWHDEHSNINFSAHVSDSDDKQTVDHHSQLADAVMAEHEDFADSEVFVSGSPRLVFSVMDALVEAGLPESQFYSDVLEYASRPEK